MYFQSVIITYFKLRFFGEGQNGYLSVSVNLLTFWPPSSLFCSMGGLKGSEDWHEGHHTQAKMYGSSRKTTNCKQ